MLNLVIVLILFIIYLSIKIYFGVRDLNRDSIKSYIPEVKTYIDTRLNNFYYPPAKQNKELDDSISKIRDRLPRIDLDTQKFIYPELNCSRKLKDSEIKMYEILRRFINNG